MTLLLALDFIKSDVCASADYLSVYDVSVSMCVCTVLCNTLSTHHT